ncbi:MAG: hypothetical protein C7B47_09790 [Sulfobacillus thermosulfidooxidans]|uniref:Glycoside hydrolase family 31 TIM barrel domain-containing protein n=1 Tax=Sulfobacillus thermosulfidooxidans TaxID=28034 RepID=A0A2T2WXB7_SULTH|nr:MAG: hypothetical protein C7B47_09790 [Sulfobacillus thermosulfidooxidans]
MFSSQRMRSYYPRASNLTAGSKKGRWALVGSQDGLKKPRSSPFPKALILPMPLWLSSAGYSAWFTSFERIRWNLTHTKRQATIWSTMTTLHIITGQTPKDIFPRQFSVLGLPASVPSWALAPWNDNIRGQARATHLAHFLRSHRIPSSVIWIEDWMGSNENRRRFWMRPLRHTVDTELYPHLPQLARTLHEQGFRLLGYFCPEITYGTDLYRQALNDDILGELLPPSLRIEAGASCFIDHRLPSQVLHDLHKRGFGTFHTYMTHIS